MSETGIIYDIKKYAIHDGPGIRTTVFFKGCPLECWWCHNPESRLTVPEHRRQLRPQKNLPLLAGASELVGKQLSAKEVMTEIRKDMVFYDESGGGVTFSGGEPLLQPDFLEALLTQCKTENIHTAVDTSGSVEFKVFEKIISKVDLFLYDIKLIDDELHKKYTGASNRLILDNLVKLEQAGAEIMVRVPLIPGITDTEFNLLGIIDFLREKTQLTDVDLIPFNQMGESKYERLEMDYRIGKLKMQTVEQVEKIKNLFSESGFQVGT